MNTTTTPQGSDTMSSAIVDAANYHNWLYKLCLPHLGNSILELGPGYGQYTRLFATGGKHVVAADIDPASLAHIAATIPDATTVLADFNQHDWKEKLGIEGGYDTAVALNLLEHIQDDAALVSKIYSLLNPGGHFLLIVPAHAQLFGQMDALAGHYRRYSRASLANMLLAAGFANVDAEYINPIGGLGWWVNAKFTKPASLSAPHINAQIRFFDRWIMPLSRGFSPLTAKFFGQSVWCCAKKSG